MAARAGRCCNSRIKTSCHLWVITFARVAKSTRERMTFEVYRNAPIIEAVLDVRVRTSDDVDIETLSAIRDPKYPEVSSEPFKLHVRLEWGDKPLKSRREQLAAPIGYFLRSPDQLQVFQVRRDGFTFNRLAPYVDWTQFSTEARRLWDFYRKSVKIEQVEAVSLTYMNEILVPFNEKFEEYLNSYIHIPEALPQEVSSFSLSFQHRLTDIDGILHVAETIGPQRREGHVTVALLIQAIKFLGTSPDLLNEEELWNLFERLREAKSRAFEACITDKVREAIR